MQGDINLEMAQSTKESTITQVVKSYGSKLMSFIRSKVRTLEDAEDILQDVWFQLSNLTQIEEIVNLSSWLYKVSNNKITDGYRRKKTLSLEDYTGVGNWEDGDGQGYALGDLLLLDAGNDPETEFFRKEIWNSIQEALAEMPHKQSSVFIAHELDKQSLQQIANQEGVSIKTIISRKHYAVSYLRKKLNKFYNEL